MPYQPPPPPPKNEQTVVSFKAMFLRDIDNLERRLEITTDHTIINNKKRILDLLSRMRYLIEQLPTT